MADETKRKRGPSTFMVLRDEGENKMTHVTNYTGSHSDLRDKVKAADLNPGKYIVVTVRDGFMVETPTTPVVRWG